VGASAFVLLETTPGARENVVFCIGGILILRLAAIRWKLVLPAFEQKIVERR
jgi:uncharacterized membrane protein YeiH